MLSLGQLGEEPAQSLMALEEGDEEPGSVQPSAQRRRVVSPSIEEGDEGGCWQGRPAQSLPLSTCLPACLPT